MNEWIDELSDLCAAGEPAVLVTVAGIRGSAPREVGAKMIVTPTETIGTIGGGQLEDQCTRIAVGLFDAAEMSLRSFPLGASMGQCCGGVVEILFEPSGRVALDGVSTTRNAIVISVLDNVRSRIYRIVPTEEGWSANVTPMRGPKSTCPRAEGSSSTPRPPTTA